MVNAVGDMYEIRDRAVELMRIPSGHGDTTVGPSFEYVPPRGKRKKRYATVCRAVPHSVRVSAGWGTKRNRPRREKRIHYRTL